MSKIYVGMDVHKDSVVVAVLSDGSASPSRVERLPNDLRRLQRFFTRLSQDGKVDACYEASSAGFVLQRALTEWGYDCTMVAPSLIPTRPGVRRKHDKRDATELARLYRAGELTAIRIPTESEERVRDLVRCRQTFQREVLRVRHYITKFLRRRGLTYRDGSHWVTKHQRWLRRILSDGTLLAEDQVVLGEYVSLLDYSVERREELDRRIEELAVSPAYRETVERLRCFRGIDTLAAMVLATELGDWRRFETPRQLMAYLGLVPTEHSSGARQHRGSITKAGNSHCRHVLCQAAWHYRHRPATGKRVKKRQIGQPPDVIAHAWKAQHRLYKLYHRVAFKKPTQVAVVAAARELVGFLWAVMQDVDAPAAEQHQACAA